MITTLDPEGLARSPFYSQGALVTDAQRTVYVSGQVGVGPDGAPGDGVAEQARLAIANLAAVLAEGGLGIDAIAKYTVYLTDPAHIEPFIEATAASLPAERPAATLLVVAQLADPALLVEIEAIAVG
ncbi:Endoribonuclease L-PSP [Beutenbergia cavernae DSM 12333]|uniref:Endoribonuclease L-PSP n=1 Tax=Beutenbergia cavernae (strain ATCC BAA-8 / DSM 12333 / CCUG 43141 / JCM 11478 / NBRC 16432 / NCIMB 13614 / HKI 0122) TaxID=471853 RepID=C5BVU9_BEUC1|nr:Rid family hydrolase [Beutenbergia cavernae]ACQ80550.1 Endoribonuclease L-PSP [Beutenbergia cavernae DSM 12333]